MVVSAINNMRKGLLFLMVLFLVSCASAKPLEKKADMAGTGHVEEEVRAETAPRQVSAPQVPEPEIPEFIPVKEGSSPLRTKTVSITARNTPLRDVLYMVAETASLNLVLERDVEPELPVTGFASQQASQSKVIVDHRGRVIFAIGGFGRPDPVGQQQRTSVPGISDPLRDARQKRHHRRAEGILEKHRHRKIFPPKPPGEREYALALAFNPAVTIRARRQKLPRGPAG